MSHFVRLFKPQFADAVAEGRKLQTVRPEPSRMPQPGDTVSLRTWTDKPYRSKQRVLREATIQRVDGIRIDDWGISLYAPGAAWSPESEQFARADGFENWEAMREWFTATHGLPFTGILICWK